jgi:MFS family permease
VRRRLGSEFRVLWAAAAVSNLGDGLRVAALPLLAATITRDPAQIAAVTAAIWTPWLLIGLYAGALADRADRPALIRNVQLARLMVAQHVVGSDLWPVTRPRSPIRSRLGRP